MVPDYIIQSGSVFFLRKKKRRIQGKGGRWARGSYVCVSVRVSKSILLLGIRYGDGFSKIRLVTTTVHLVFGSFFRLIR